jgi:hypothetical protein
MLLDRRKVFFKRDEKLIYFSSAKTIFFTFWNKFSLIDSSQDRRLCHARFILLSTPNSKEGWHVRYKKYLSNCPFLEITAIYLHKEIFH